MLGTRRIDGPQQSPFLLRDVRTQMEAETPARPITRLAPLVASGLVLLGVGVFRLASNMDAAAQALGHAPDPSSARDMTPAQRAFRMMALREKLLPASSYSA